MRLTKYAEWVDKPCGKCRMLIDIGSIVKEEIDPICFDHQMVECLVCGGVVERSTVAHGVLGRTEIHTVQWKVR